MTDPQGRLGEPVRTFDGRARHRRTWAWLLSLSLASLALIPAAVAYLNDRVWWAGVPALALSMGYAGGAGWIAGRDRALVRNRVVRLHTGGISLTGPGDGDAAYTWDELASVTVSGVRSGPDEDVRWRFTIVARDGNVLRLTEDLPDVRELGLAVAEQVTARLVPRHLAAVKAGKAVWLAPFTVDLDGVEKDGERVPWAAVTDVAIDNGLVVVHACAADLVTVAAQMPDALAFTALCHQVRMLPGRS